MVAYNFKAQFVPAIESFIKSQTIRALGAKRHARSGEAVQLYTGMRTAQCRKLLNPDPVCIKAEPIGISSTQDVFVGHGSGIQRLSDDAIKALAIADGFESVDDFFEFFRTTHGLPFTGLLIKWQPQPRSSTDQ